VTSLWSRISWSLGVVRPGGCKASPAEAWKQHNWWFGLGATLRTIMAYIYFTSITFSIYEIYYAYIYIYIYIYILLYIYICVYKLEIMGILKQQASPFSVCLLIVIGFLYIYICTSDVANNWSPKLLNHGWCTWLTTGIATHSSLSQHWNSWRSTYIIFLQSQDSEQLTVLFAQIWRCMGNRWTFSMYPNYHEGLV
jgi:hypothetical protein